jgi:hypothetical protein
MVTSSLYTMNTQCLRGYQYGSSTPKKLLKPNLLINNNLEFGKLDYPQRYFLQQIVNAPQILNFFPAFEGAASAEEKGKVAAPTRRLPEDFRGGLPAKLFDRGVGDKLEVDLVPAVREKGHFQGAEHLPGEVDQPPESPAGEVAVEH